MSKLDAIVAKNITLGTSAAFLEAGRIANNQVTKIAATKLPVFFRGYADTPVGRLIVANLAQLAAEHFRKDDARLTQLTNAMTVSAYQELLQTLDVEAFIDEMTGNATIKKALNSVQEASGKAGKAAAE